MSSSVQWQHCLVAIELVKDSMRQLPAALDAIVLLQKVVVSEEERPLREAMDLRVSPHKGDTLSTHESGEDSCAQVSNALRVSFAAGLTSQLLPGLLAATTLPSLAVMRSLGAMLQSRKQALDIRIAERREVRFWSCRPCNDGSVMK